MLALKDYFILRLLPKKMSSSKEDPPPPSITTCDVIQGPSLLQTPVTRPSPSLLSLPGFWSLPFWTSPDHSRVAYGDPIVTQVVQHLESHVNTSQDKYLKVTPTLKSDYEDTDMKGLHQGGEWEWHSYLNKGSVQGNFALQFPKNSKILQEL